MSDSSPLRASQDRTLDMNLRAGAVTRKREVVDGSIDEFFKTLCRFILGHFFLTFHALILVFV